jgi:hypothetical protein
MCNKLMSVSSSAEYVANLLHGQVTLTLITNHSLRSSKDVTGGSLLQCTSPKWMQYAILHIQQPG